MRLEFEWNPRKGALNERIYHVALEEAATVFGDPLATTVPDPQHSELEDRGLTAGSSYRQRLLVVRHTDRGDTVRIIGARGAAVRELRDYESGE